MSLRNEWEDELEALKVKRDDLAIQIDDLETDIEGLEIALSELDDDANNEHLTADNIERARDINRARGYY